MAFDPTQAKSILQSKTFWGALIALVAVLFPGTFAKIGIPQADLVDKVVGGIGAVLAIYGRFSATQMVTLTGK
jgi:hypothetical protein